MAVIKCKMCGGSMEIGANETTAVCEYCGTLQTLPKLDSERIAALYERAELLRSSNDFDKAAAVYEQIVMAEPTDAEAYWSLVLCRYGIEYVEDPQTKKRVPTVNRVQPTSVLQDPDYRQALRYADEHQSALYQEEAAVIQGIQQQLLAISRKEAPFDIFICYKETDDHGHRTLDSVLAADMYRALTQEGYRVFFARITLEDKLGVAYEPYIFAALQSARIMFVVGTKPEYFQAPWVKNEWGRYWSMIRGGADKTLIPVYRDMDPHDLPEEFAHLQALDFSRLGAMQDLIHGTNKILNHGEEPLVKKPKQKKRTKVWPWIASAVAVVAVVAVVLVSSAQKKAAAYENAQALLESGAYVEAAEAFGALEDYKDSAAQKTAAEELEQARLLALQYEDAVALLNDRNYEEAVSAFTKLDDYGDSAELLKQAQEGVLKTGEYQTAAEIMANGDYETAITLWQRLGDFSDSREQLVLCQTEWAWSRFRTCIDGVETVDFDAAAIYLEELTEVDLPLAAEYRDSGYFELAKLAYAADDAVRAQLYLESINDTVSFDDFETMTEEVRILSIYLEAQAITVTNNDTKAALQALIDQLPEGFRDVAELKQRIVNYNAAIAASAKQDGEWKLVSAPDNPYHLVLVPRS